jgi:hypothetical protein
VQFLAGADADDFDLGFGGDGAGQVDNFGAGDFGDEDFAAFHLFDAGDDEVHALLEREPEAGHALVGDGDFAVGALLEEERDDRAALPTTLP